MSRIHHLLGARLFKGLTLKKIRIFTDIDDTLIATGRKIPENQRQQVSATNLQGQPSSYSTQAQLALWQALQVITSEPVVAVTARSAESLQRVQFQFEVQAVVDFGATVLTAAGVPDPTWYERLTACKDRGVEENLRQLAAEISAVPLGVNVSVCETPANLAFVTFRLPQELHVELRRTIFHKLEAHGIWSKVLIHETDRDIAVMPAYINKGDAVRYLIDKNNWHADVKLGCADSLCDMAFLQYMDFSVLPQESRALTGLRSLAASLKAL